MTVEPNLSVTYPSEVLSKNYYPSLNGLRGISIILVVVFHLQPAASIIFNGHLGVNIFFVLSGFLITTLCIKELNQTKRLSLANFYIRRFLRIFPVAYLYLFILLLLNFIVNWGIPWFQLAGAAFFVMNFSFFRSHSFTWAVSHYWSLSTEEQFYLIFPFLLARSRRTFVFAVIFIVFFLPILCLLQALYDPLGHGAFYIFVHYFIKFQAIAVGCLYSILAFNKVFDTKLLAQTKLIGNVLALFFIFYLRYDDFYSIKAIFTNDLISMLTGYIIISNLAPASDIIYKVLNFKLLSFIGVLSYSIYIWQQLFTAYDPHLSKYMVTYPFNLIWIILVPCLSYFFYERYFLTLKQKFKILKGR